MTSEYIIYVPWPEQAVREALEEFKRQMYSDAGPEELRKGILCLDFLTRASELPQQLTDFIEYAIDEAEMRIQLMVMAEEQHQTQQEAQEAIDKCIKSIRMVRHTCDNLMKRATSMGDDPEYVKQVKQEIEKLIARDRSSTQ